MTSYYPFNLDGALCPLLNNREILAGFYAEETLRHGIKNFCKKTAWPGKPAVSFAINPEKLEELLLSLFNTPAARAELRRQSESDRVTYLDNAIWHWFSSVNPALAQRVGRICDDVKDRLFLKAESLQKFLAEIKEQHVEAAVRTQLAYLILAFAMLQTANRQEFGELFLAAFPEFAPQFGAAAGSL